MAKCCLPSVAFMQIETGNNGQAETRRDETSRA